MARSRPAGHAWSLYFGRIAGIPVRIHFTFWLLLIWVAWMEYTSQGTFFGEVVMVLGIFGCVVLHELGHALTARRYGIRTRNIVLYPIGGIATLESMGKPRQELWIALAGPFTNILIAGVLWAGLELWGTPFNLRELAMGDPNFVQRLIVINVFIAAFNMLPAFPMDGGRVLRAVLSLRLGKSRGTAIAARVGQGFAVLMGLGGLLLGHFGLMFIAFFVFLGASGESVAQARMDAISGYRVRDAMMTRFETLHHGDTLQLAVDHLLATHQQDYPVVHGDEVLGVLTRRDLMHALSTIGPNELVANVMNRQFPRLSPDDDLQAAMELLSGRSPVPVLVFAGDRLIGMVTVEHLMEFLMVSRTGAAPEADPGIPNPPRAEDQQP